MRGLDRRIQGSSGSLLGSSFWEAPGPSRPWFGGPKRRPGSLGQALLEAGNGPRSGSDGVQLPDQRLEIPSGRKNEVRIGFDRHLARVRSWSTSVTPALLGQLASGRKFRAPGCPAEDGRCAGNDRSRSGCEERQDSRRLFVDAGGEILGFGCVTMRMAPPKNPSEKTDLVRQCK